MTLRRRVGALLTALAVVVLVEQPARTSDHAATAQWLDRAISAHLLAAPDSESAASLAMLVLLQRKGRMLEAELSAHAAARREPVAPVTLYTVQAAIPDDAALVEFAVFQPIALRASRRQPPAAPRYAAYVLRRHGPPRGFDLGLASDVNAAIAAMRDAVRDPKRTDANNLARDADERVMRPLRAAIAGATRLILSPDGELSLVPFEAMLDERGRYLLERFTTSYVTSGRDLLRMRVARPSRGGPVVFADPFFGEPAAPRAGSAVDRTSMYFAPLPATAGEARAIKVLFPDATIFSGPRATKAALQHVAAPRMLHIAAHGFFLDAVGAKLGNPLLRSGVALAGANLPGGRETAILTALDASGLDLWGTKLVTLSACDTGLGDVRNGEGVYGLRRAFAEAGAETLVMTLWPVPDAIARETMVAYYTELRTGAGRSEALRRSKLALLARPGRAHPYYWAPFIQSGEWTTIDGTA
jgi:CHAT domain-containing protein